MKKITMTLALFALSVTLAPAAPAGDDDGPEWDWFGSLRLRPEYNENMSDVFGGRDDRIAYAAYRANLGAKIGLDRDVTVVFNGQVLGLFGEDESPLRGTTSLDSTSAKFNLFNAYVEAKNLFGSKFSMRAGRQPLVFGDEWLLGDLEFYGGTSWDGLRGDFDREGGETSVFWAKVVETNTPESIALSEDIGGDSDLYGIWSNWDIGDKSLIEGGVLYLLDHRTLNDHPFQDKRWTYTVQYAYNPEGEAGWFGRVNAAIQRGTTLDVLGVDTTDIEDAIAYEGTGGHVWIKDGNPYKLWVRLAEYSGDDTTTEEIETFIPLAQDTHGRYGYLDMWTGQWGFTQFLGGSPGFQAIQFGAKAHLPSGIRLSLLVQQLRRSERFAPDESNINLGEEYAVTAAYDYGKNATIELGVAQLYPGTSMELEPPFFGSSTTRRVYVHTVVHF